MAHIIPSDITELALAGARAPELATLARLRRDLPGDYVIFHGVHWSREYAGYTVYGEVDFVVVNRAGRVLLVEQKNGPLTETDAGLVKGYASGPKSVNDQVRRALDNVREKFRWVHGRAWPLDLDYLVYCPDYTVVNLNAAALDRTRIVDATAATQLASRIVAILGSGDGGDAAWQERVLGFFRQSFEVVPNVHAHVSSQEKHFTRLGRGLARFLMGLEMTPFRLRVSGTAGCGKTLVAEQMFERVVGQGKRPLLVCFNRPLAEKLRHVMDEPGMVTTWYGLCDRFLAERGHRPAQVRERLSLQGPAGAGGDPDRRRPRSGDAAPRPARAVLGDDASDGAARAAGQRGESPERDVSGRLSGLRTIAAATASARTRARLCTLSRLSGVVIWRRPVRGGPCPLPCLRMALTLCCSE